MTPAPDMNAKDDDEHESIKTPVKRLFEGCDDEGEEVVEFGAQKRAKKEQDARVAAIQEEMLPKPIRKARKAAAAQNEPQEMETGGSEEVPGMGKGKAKGRGRGKGRGKGKASPKAKSSPKAKAKTQKIPISPSIKKERSRRQRRQAPAPADNNEELHDELLLGILKQKLKRIDVLTFDDLKVHLLHNGGDFGESYLRKSALSVYWGRVACGVKYMEDPKYPQVFYFGVKHPRVKAYNVLMTMACTAGLLVVSFQHFVVFRFQQLDMYVSIFQKNI